MKDLSNAKIIAIDIETYDPGLGKSMGPGVYRNDGYILGVSIADDNDYAEYFNLGHYDCTEELRNKNIEYLKQVLSLDIPKLGTNIIYDIDWLENWIGNDKFGWRGKGPQFKVNGLLYDIQVAEPLIDENQGHYSLDFQAKKYLGVGKYKTEIDSFCEENELKGDSRAWLWKMPYSLVRKYAIEDVCEPLKIFKMQWEIMQKDDLIDVFLLETKLLRAILHMRRNGVYIDSKVRNKNAMNAFNEYEKIIFDLNKKYGKINYNSTKQIAELFDRENVPYNFKITYNNGEEDIVAYDIGKDILQGKFNERVKIATHGKYDEIKICNPTLPKEYLLSLEEDYPQVKDILFVRKADKMINTFLMGSLTEFVTSDNMIHPSIYNVRNDDFGTRSGRLSMSNPNLQQIPSKGVDAYWGAKCREVFAPLPNCWWAKLDYSQIEYRCMAHFASGPGSKELVSSYINDPHTDYHQYIMDLTGLKRRFAKNLNFGIAYGMGKYHMAEFFNWTLDYAEEVLEIYHSKAPYVKSTVKSVENVAKTRGYIKTLSGRRSRLLNKDKAYIMFCRLLQGSAADMMKKAMLDIYESGLLGDVRNFDNDWYGKKVFEHITVHDELDFSVPKTAEGIRALFDVRKLMQSAYKLKVPIKADVEIGSNWSTVVELEVDDEWLNSLTNENVVEKVESMMGKSLNK